MSNIAEGRGEVLDSSLDQYVENREALEEGGKIYDILQAMPVAKREEDKMNEKKDEKKDQESTVIESDDKIFKRLFLNLLEKNDHSFFKFCIKIQSCFWSFNFFSTNSLDFKFQKGKYIFLTPYLNEKFDCVLSLLPQDKVKIVSNPDGIENFIWIEDFLVFPTDNNLFQQLEIDCR